MIQSMTGFGRGEAHTDRLAATVELRSVNNRFCEVRARLPRLLAPYETEVQQRVQTALARGKIDVTVQFDRHGEDALGLRVDVEAVQAYARLMRDVRDAAGLDEPIGLDHVLRSNELFTRIEDEGEEAAAWPVMAEALDEALSAMQGMRRREGEALEADLTERLDEIERELEQAERRAPVRVEEARTRLQERVQGLLEENRIDPDRLEQEIALLADRLDVTEECVRLRSHLQQFRSAMRTAEPVGRKLNFLTQEMNREINTIGSKANDAPLAHHAVTMKEALEKIREQVQNVL